jgi:hypothetical protein
MPPVNRNQPKRAKSSESQYSLMEFTQSACSRTTLGTLTTIRLPGSRTFRTRQAPSAPTSVQVEFTPGDNAFEWGQPAPAPGMIVTLEPDAFFEDGTEVARRTTVAVGDLAVIFAETAKAVERLKAIFG